MAKRSLPRRRKSATPTKSEALIGALTSLVPARRSAPGGKLGGRRKSAGGVALLAGLAGVALKAKHRRTPHTPH